MTQNELQKFKYDNKCLAPYQRQEQIKEHLQKAIALLDVEIIIQAMYDQMDYGSLNMEYYKQAKENLEKVIQTIKY